MGGAVLIPDVPIVLGSSGQRSRGERGGRDGKHLGRRAVGDVVDGVSNGDLANERMSCSGIGEEGTGGRRSGRGSACLVAQADLERGIAGEWSDGAHDR